MPDLLHFQNEDLLLRVNRNVDPARFDISRYESFLDALCTTREYQKEAIRIVLSYLMGGRYNSLRQLAEENFNSSEQVREYYRTFHELEQKLQFPDQLSCSVDLATATGKSYVMYGIARIMLAEGVVDRVLVLCPSRTIENGLITKFRELSSDPVYLQLLPSDARIRNPHIINATESIVEGTICIENDDAALRHVGSSIRSSLRGKGARTLVLNDEVHHVYNATSQGIKRWKEFLLDPEFGFRCIAGFSGTCYIENEYFSDVVTRYSLRQAIEDGFAKRIDYVAEDVSSSQDEQFQKIYDNHLQNKTQYYRKVKPLTFLVTRDIPACRRLTSELTDFLVKQEGISAEDAADKVLIVTSAAEHAANLRRLDSVDSQESPVEWITSVSMLTEGWDVQNVFQIVPHEERAFNSKLLIAQVLGRGLRIPSAYRGERPIVTVFNHSSWSSRIKTLVDEVMEAEKRIASYPITKSVNYNFTLHHVNYTKEQEAISFEQRGEYEFSKGYISLASQVATLEKETGYIRAISGEQRQKKTLVRYRMYSIDEVAEHLHSKLKAIDIEEGTSYAQKYSFEWLQELVRASLRRVGEEKDMVSEENRQRLQRGFGVIHRKAAHTVRYREALESVYNVNTAERPRDSIGVASLRRMETSIFYDENSQVLSDEPTKLVLQEVFDDDSLPRSAVQSEVSQYDFKTPLNVVIADHKPERDFASRLVKRQNAAVVDCWIKSTDRGFYEIEYAWRKGEHPKRGFFSPDFFIKVGTRVYVIEIKADEQIDNPSDENKGKFKAAQEHFALLNAQQSEFTYHFHFLTPRDYDAFFQFLRDGNFNYVSSLDAVLGEGGPSRLMG